MIKDKIIKTNEINYYILEEIEYDNKKYVMAAECNLEKDTFNDEKYIIMEIKIENNELITADIEDMDLASTIANLLIEKIKNSN